MNIPSSVVICGGGGVGISSAYWLSKAARASGAKIKIKVVEKDPGLLKASSMRSAASCRQQFSLKENIQLSHFSSKFFQTEIPSNFVQMPYFFFTGTDQGEETLRMNHNTQKSVSPDECSTLIDQAEVKKLFPEFNASNVTLGCIGNENIEGFFDAALYLKPLKTLAKENGVEFCTGEVVDFDTTRPDKIVVTHKNGNQITKDEAAKVVLATGAWSLNLTRLLGVPDSEFPVRARRRVIYVVRSNEWKPDMNLHAMFCCPNGVYFRPEPNPGYFIAGCHPEEDPDYDPDNTDLEQTLAEDETLFNEKIWPTMAEYFPGVFESIKLQSQWAGFYEYNIFDHNLLLGYLDSSPNVLVATGSSGHGIQQTPAVGRAVMELLLTGKFQTIDLSRFDANRKEPVLELNII